MTDGWYFTKETGRAHYFENGKPVCGKYASAGKPDERAAHPWFGHRGGMHCTPCNRVLDEREELASAAEGEQDGKTGRD